MICSKMVWSFQSRIIIWKYECGKYTLLCRTNDDRWWLFRPAYITFKAKTTRIKKYHWARICRHVYDCVKAVPSIFAIIQTVQCSCQISRCDSSNWIGVEKFPCNSANTFWKNIDFLLIKDVNFILKVGTPAVKVD